MRCDILHRIPLQEVDKKALDQLCSNRRHFANLPIALYERPTPGRPNDRALRYGGMPKEGCSVLISSITRPAGSDGNPM